MLAPAFSRFARLAAIALTLPGSSAMAQSSSAGSSAPDWSWLKNTVWIVPPAYLPSFLYNAQTNVLLPAADQTVYTITDYRNGYFWGKTVAKVGALPVSCSSLIASVTRKGSCCSLS